MAEQERDLTQNSSVPVLTDMGPPISNRGGPDDADNTEDESHHLSVYEIDPPHDNSATPKRRHRIVVHIHGYEFALGHSSQPELRAAAERTQLYQAQLGVEVTVPYAVDFLVEKLHTLTRQFSQKSPRYATQTTTTCRTTLSAATLTTCANSAHSRRWSNTTMTPKRLKG